MTLLDSSTKWACVLALALTQFSSGVGVVEVYVAVPGADGTPMADLTATDFEVYEDGRRQVISTFAAGEFPLAVALALDRSFSMAGERLDLATRAARQFLGALRPTDRSMVIAVGSEVEAWAPFGGDRASQLERLGALQPWGTTRLHDAIIAAIDLVQPESGRRALVILSDGDDRFSAATATQALDHARRADVIVYPIALGRKRPELFAELAVLTGGRSFLVRDPKALGDTLMTIARELRHQYLIGYTPARPFDVEPDRWRAIRVTAKGGLRVRARDGYYPAPGR